MPQALHKLLIDFDLDGDWSEVINDVSADVQRVTRTYGKNLLKQRAEAGILEVILKNDDHQYTSMNTASPLYPYSIPGPSIWYSVGYPVDTFDADDATTLTGRKPDYDDLFAAWEGDTGDFDVLSNQLRTPVGGDYQAVLDFGECDCWVGVEFTRNGANSGLILRYADTDNYWIVRCDGTTLYLDKVVAGVPANVKNAAYTWGAGVTHRITVRLHGTRVDVYIDDQLSMVEDSGDTFNQASTKHGIGGTATNTADRWDDFGGWRTVFAGRVDTITIHPRKGEQYAYIKAYDDMERLAKHQIYKEGILTYEDLIFYRILLAADVPAGQMTAEYSGQLTYDNESVMGRDALTELYQLQDDAVGFYYIDGAIHRYEPFDHRDSAPHTVALKSWYATRQLGDETDIVFQDLRPEAAKDLIENEGYYLYYKLTIAAGLTNVWELTTATDYVNDRPDIDNGVTLTFLSIGQGDFLANPRIPYPGTDFKINTAADDTGTDLTLPEDNNIGALTGTANTLDDAGQDFTDWNDGNCIIVVTDTGGKLGLGWIAATNPDGDGTKVDIKDASDLATAGYAYEESGFDPTLPASYNVYNCWAELQEGWEGNYAQIAIRNGSGSDGYITILRLMAQEGTKSDKRGARCADTASATAYGRRRIEHETLHIDRYDEALNRVTERITRRKDLKYKYEVMMRNATRACLMQIVHRNLSDRVNLVVSDMNLDGDAFIEAQRLEVTQGAQLVESTWTLLEV